MGGGSQTGAQESPSTSDVELEYDIVPPDKGKGKAVPNNTAQGGSGHDPPKERTWDGLASKVKKVAETSAKAQRKMQASLSSLDQCISALRKKYQGRAETSRS